VQWASVSRAKKSGLKRCASAARLSAGTPRVSVVGGLRAFRFGLVCPLPRPYTRFGHRKLCALPAGSPTCAECPLRAETASRGKARLPVNLRRSRARSATAALRRLRPSPARKKRRVWTARRTGQFDPRATFDFEKGCGDRRDALDATGVGRPCIPRGS
jgi:hypothetical protein